MRNKEQFWLSSTDLTWQPNEEATLIIRWISAERRAIQRRFQAMEGGDDGHQWQPTPSRLSIANFGRSLERTVPADEARWTGSISIRPVAAGEQVLVRVHHPSPQESFMYLGLFASGVDLEDYRRTGVRTTTTTATTAAHAWVLIERVHTRANAYFAMPLPPQLTNH